MPALVGGDRSLAVQRPAARLPPPGTYRIALAAARSWRPRNRCMPVRRVNCWGRRAVAAITRRMTRMTPTAAAASPNPCHAGGPSDHGGHSRRPSKSCCLPKSHRILTTATTSALVGGGEFAPGWWGGARAGQLRQLWVDETACSGARGFDQYEGGAPDGVHAARQATANQTQPVRWTRSWSITGSPDGGNKVGNYPLTVLTATACAFVVSPKPYEWTSHSDGAAM